MRRALALILSASIALSPLQPAWAGIEAAPLAVSGDLSGALVLPPVEALERLGELSPTDPSARAALELASLSELSSERISAVFGAEKAPVIEASLRAWRTAAESDARIASRLHAARLEASERDARASASIARSLFEDLIRKFASGSDITQLGPSEAEVLAEAPRLDDREISGAPLSLLVERVVERFQPGLDAGRKAQRVGETMRWFREKYGVADRPLLAEAGNARGSYQTPGAVKFSVGAARLPSLFDPSSPSSIQDLDGYIARKWGGLGSAATPSHIVFSELGTTDTLAGLRSRGFERFRLVNAPYASRGSKTLIASLPGDPAPYVVLYSFVSRDLLDHKLMQLSMQYGAEFAKVQVLGSDNLKSWEVADLVVSRAVRALPPRPIDDLVVGYPGAVEGVLSKDAKPLESTRIGDFATIKYYAVAGKNGIPRTAAVLTDIELRYFGKSVLALVKPFLDRGLDRVLFAGSAGSLDPSIPVNGLVVPRSFHLLEKKGGLSRPILDNDLFDLLPYGVAWSGPHLSVSSPLLETQSRVKQLRDGGGVLSVDVEGSQLAELIRSHNETHGGRIRFGAAFIVTDTPVAEGEAAKTGYGLHKPDYKGKAQAKGLYAAALELLWDLPGRYAPSNHTRLIGRHYARRIAELQRGGDSVALAELYAELEKRLERVRSLSRDDRRVSRGLAKTYLDLLRELDRLGAAPLPKGYVAPREKPPKLEPLSRAAQRVLLLQSLTRSSTLNSGDTGYVERPEAARRKALENAERAVDYILARSDWPLDIGDYYRLHAILNEGVLPKEELGRIRDFTYKQQDGEVVSSAKELEAYADWLGSAAPTPENALEAFLRLEELHPAKDGNGRAAELMAQHMMLRASGHPLVFPNRFDIDYILSLRRNGSYGESDARQLSDLLRRSGEFSSWLTARIPDLDASDSRLDPGTGLVDIEAGGRRWAIRPLFKASDKFFLERERREFLPDGQAFPEGALRQPRTGYEAAFSLEALPPSAPRPAAAAIDEGPFLNFGGSFSPPTLEHMGLMAHIMHRLGLIRGKMVVALPYKQGAAPAEVSLDLTNVAVENFREVLALNSIPYTDFTSSNGGSSWKTDGRRYSLAVETYDIRTQNKEDTLKTLEYLQKAHGGSAKANYWISGADSFGSVPTWTPRWRELFERTNWVVVSRPGFSGPGSVDFNRRDPLRGVLEDAFLANYAYSFDEARQMHVYRHLDPEKPGIFVVDQPTLGDSSTNNRKSLAEEGDHEHAQAGLQPSVFRRALEKGYYGGRGGYQAFTGRNLEGALSYLFGRIENPDGDVLPMGQKEDYERLTRALIESSETEARKESAKPWYRKTAGAVAEHVSEIVETVASLRNFNDTVRRLTIKMGKIAVVYLVGELIELFVLPPVLYLVAGPAGLAVVPFLHPNEFIVMPTYFAWTVWKRHQRQRKLAGGDYKLYKRLNDYLHRLLRGDPESVVARVELRDALGLGGAPVALDIVKSRLPKWLPLWLRRLDDRRVSWHDLNVSTNELRAILRNDALAKILEERSEGKAGLFAHRLAAAAFVDPEARVRFELFLSQRYFRRLALGDTPVELLGGFRPEERRALERFKGQSESYRQALDAKHLDAFRDAVADVYALVQAARVDPARVHTDGFWTDYLDLLITRYPDEKLSMRSQSVRRELAWKLPLIARMASALQPEFFSGASITYRGKELLKIGASRSGEDPWKMAKAGAAVDGHAVENYVAHFVESNRDLFIADRPNAENAPLRLLETLPEGGAVAGNLVWELRQFDSHVKREHSVLAEGYSRGEKTLAKRAPHRDASKVFWSAAKRADQELEELQRQEQALEFEWLILKFPHRIGPGSDDETTIPGYAGIAGRWRALQARIENKLENLRTLNHMMLGTIPADVSTPDALRASIASRMR